MGDEALTKRQKDVSPDPGAIETKEILVQNHTGRFNMARLGSQCGRAITGILVEVETSFFVPIFYQRDS